MRVLQVVTTSPPLLNPPPVKYYNRNTLNNIMFKIGYDWLNLYLILTVHTIICYNPVIPLPPLEYILVSKEPQCLYLIYTCGAALAANIVLVVLSYTIAYHSLLITSLFMTLIGFIPSFTMLYFGVGPLPFCYVYFPFEWVLERYF